jgi:Carboxypeptidase regulatory-like domain
MRPVRAFAFLVAPLVFAGVLLSQTGTTSLRGTVTDKTGAAVANARVTISNPGRGFERLITSGETGSYEFLQLQPGTYELTVEVMGFRKYELKNLQLLVDLPGTANVTLDVGTATESVEVSAEGAVINTTDASIGNAFNELQVKTLPIEERNIPDLLSLQAGVSYTGHREDINPNSDTRSGAVNGARSDQSNITLDGTDVNDQVNGYAFTSVLPVTLDSVQEFRVTTTNYGADEGRSSGAQVALVTKSGTNTFHGSAYEYLRNTYTSSNDYFIKQSQLAANQPNVPPKLNYNIFGASFGGPIRKDRLFFFANYEGERRVEEVSAVRIVPSDALRAGYLTYLCADPSQCPGGSPPAGDPTPLQQGYYALTPDQIKSMDPLHIGLNSVVMSYFNTFPHANDFSQGDGFNFVGYRFRDPAPRHHNYYIGRVDYKINSNGSHTLFWRGALKNQVATVDPPYLPGTSPVEVASDNSSGFTAGYTAIFRPTLINNFRWGLTRQSLGFSGNTSTPVVFFRGLNDNSLPNDSTLAFVYSNGLNTPVHNLVDDVVWTKGRHAIQFGGNVRFIRNPRTSLADSFPSATTNSSGLNTAGIANTGSPLDPGNNGLPKVDGGFNLNYNYPIMAAMGILSQLNATYNFDKNGNALPLGAPLNRRYAANEYEMYIQDSFRAKPNLTLNYGLRYSIFSPPWETSGTQVAPSPSLHDWFNTRLHEMLAGQGSNSDATITYTLAGPVNGKPSYYEYDFHNFGPRVSFAYSPHVGGGWLKNLLGGDKTVIRGGAGIVYDHIGQGLLTTFDRDGAFGLSTTLTNSITPCVCANNPNNAPRLTSLTDVGQSSPLFPGKPQGGFPFVFPDAGTGLAIYFGLDNKIKTPYSYTLNLTVGRQLARDTTMEVSYVGRLSRRLLAQEDMAMPLDIIDKKAGMDYFTAAQAISKMGFAGTMATSGNLGPAAQFWQDLLPKLQPGEQYLDCAGNATSDPVTEMYNVFACAPFGDETTAQGMIDFYGTDFSGNPGFATTLGNYYPTTLGPNTFFNHQFHSLFAWRSIGSADYNALQVTLRKSLSRGVQFDFNYTYSKSMDISSDAERVGFNGGLSSGLGGVINTWNPGLQRGISDFDTTHQVNANWIVQLPLGKGRRFGANSGRALDAVIGGWELSGLTRWTSGFPVNISNGATWPTDWQLPGNATVIGPIHAQTTQGVLKAGEPVVSVFPSDLPDTFLCSTCQQYGKGPFRHDFPGEVGGRNQVRGDGYSGFDMALGKMWKMPYKESHSLDFRWEVFNVFNVNRFDVASITNGIDQGEAFGNYSGLLTSPRVMQFSLRYEF